jgi:hypothetical protein
MKISRVAMIIDVVHQPHYKDIRSTPGFLAVTDQLQGFVDAGVIPSYWTLAGTDENFSSDLEDCGQPELAQIARLFGAMLRNAQSKIEKEQELRRLREDAAKWQKFVDTMGIKEDNQ